MATWGEEQEEEINGILQQLGVSEAVKAKFCEEKVYASTVRLLTDSELDVLGLCLGDRVTLRKLCDEAVKSRTVSQEVRSILSPLPHASGGRPQFLERRPKRKGKSKLAAEKYSPTPTHKARGSATFQKKFVVIDYMGERAPRKFALRESYILMRGILPELALRADESTVRSCVTDAIKHSEETLTGLEPTGFEFLEACGKCLCVPAHDPGFVWTGRAVKALAGTGSIYVRLTVEREEGSSEEGGGGVSDDDSSGSEKPEVKIVKVEERGAVTSRRPLQSVSPGSQPFSVARYSTRSRSQPVFQSPAVYMTTKPSASSPPTTSRPSSSSPTVTSRPSVSPSVTSRPSSSPSVTSRPSVSPSVTSRPSVSPSMTSRPSTFSGELQTANVAQAGSGSSSSAAPRDQSQQPSTSASPSTGSNKEPSNRNLVSVSGDNLQFLSSAFPKISTDKLQFVLGLYEGDVDKASAFFVGGVTLASLLKVLRSFLVDDDEEAVEWVKLQTMGDGEELKKAAMEFYRSEEVNLGAMMKVEVEEGGPQDEGGVRRQFLSSVVDMLKSSLFEGPPVRLRPIFKQSSISSGSLLTLGKMVGHSIVLDGLGFPFLSPPCYYAMAGRMDLAVSTLDVSDGGSKVERAVMNLRSARTADDLLKVSDEVLDLMEESGCDKLLKVDNVESICSELLGYNVLQKRRLMLDTFAEGLDSFLIKSAFRAFPLLFEPLFVSSGKCCPSDVLGILKFYPGESWLEGDARRIAEYLKTFIKNLDETELMDFVKCVTGSPHCQGNSITVRFSASEDGPDIEFRTCIKLVVISQLIGNEEDFCLGLKAAITHAFNTA